MRVLKAEINFSWGRTQLKYDLRPADWGQQNIEWRRKTEKLFSSSDQRSLQSGPGSRPAVALEGRKLGLWSPVSSPGKDQSGWTMQCPPNTDLFEKIDIKELMCCKVPICLKVNNHISLFGKKAIRVIQRSLWRLRLVKRANNMSASFLDCKTWNDSLG